MRSYLNHLEQMYDERTHNRKIDYIRYNFSKIFQSFKDKNISVLEIGPGMGEFVCYLNTKGVTDIDIVDNDKSVAEFIQKKYKVNAGLVSEDVEKIDFKLRKYDLIVLIQVLEHIPIKKHINVLKVLYRHLKVGGVIAVVVPNANNPLGMVERYGDLQHFTSFTEQSLKDMVIYSKINNSQVMVKGFSIPPFNLINIIRIFFQSMLHKVLLLLLIINGGIYFKIMTPNIMLIVRRNR